MQVAPAAPSGPSTTTTPASAWAPPGTPVPEASRPPGQSPPTLAPPRPPGPWWTLPAGFVTATLGVLLLWQAYRFMRYGVDGISHFYDIEPELYYLATRGALLVDALLMGIGAGLVLAGFGLVVGWPWARRFSLVVLPFLLLLWCDWALRATGSDALAAGSSAYLWAGYSLLAVFATTAVFVILLIDRPSWAWFSYERFDTTPAGRWVRGWRVDARKVGAIIPFSAFAWGLLILGVALRIASLKFMEFRADGQTYTAMGGGWADYHAFLMPWGDITTAAYTPAQYSHHYPPAYPFVLGLFYSIFGWGVWQTQLADLVMSLAALGAVYWCSVDLYGRDKGVWVAGLLAVEPHLIWATGSNFSENLVLLFFAFTMWGIVKSLEKPAMIVVAGTAAGLAYLTRSSIGGFFLVAGVGGFLWRFLFMRWKVFTNKYYLMAVAIFGTMVFLWAWRNIGLFGAPDSTAGFLARGAEGWPSWDAPWSAAANPIKIIAHLAKEPSLAAGAFVAALVGLGIFYLGRPRDVPGAARMDAQMYWALASIAAVVAILGIGWVGLNDARHGSPEWETSSYTTYVQEHAFDHGLFDQTAGFGHAMAYKLPFFGVFFLLYAVWFRPSIMKGLRKIRDEHESALWLGVVLLFLISWLITSMFWTFEKSPMYWLDNHRYIVIAYLPLLWIIARHDDVRRPGFKLRSVALASVLLIMTYVVFISPVRWSENAAVESLDGYIRPGDEFVVKGYFNKYSIYAYIPEHDLKVSIFTQEAYDNGARPEWIMTSEKDFRPDDYVCLGDYSESYYDGNTLHTYMLMNEDVDYQGPRPAVDC